MITTSLKKDRMKATKLRIDRVRSERYHTNIHLKHRMKQLLIDGEIDLEEYINWQLNPWDGLIQILLKRSSKKEVFPINKY